MMVTIQSKPSRHYSRRNQLLIPIVSPCALPHIQIVNEHLFFSMPADSSVLRIQPPEQAPVSFFRSLFLPFPVPFSTGTGKNNLAFLPPLIILNLQARAVLHTIIITIILLYDKFI